MTGIDAVQLRLQQTSDLAGVLDAAYEAFEGMMSAIHPVQDPGSGLFAVLVMAAASAANGRNALALAPSLPGHPLPGVPAGQRPWPGEPPERVAEVVAGLSHLVAERLAQAAGSAADTGDRAAHQADRGGEHAQEVAGSLLHVITVMGRYLQDLAAVPGGMASRAAPPLTTWGRARLTARDALSHASRHLRQRTWGTRAPGVAARSELARRLDAAAVALMAGRDLLHTHLARDPRGARQFRSEWGLVACSPPAERALLAELAALARQIAAPCTDLALSARVPDTADARRGLRAACGWLQVLSTCVQAAPQADPVSADDRDLLLAIPLNAPLPRPVLDGSEPVTALYDAVITSAERARHAAWATGTQPAWSPHLTADSLRQVAATSTVTSHHCEILLRSLAARTADTAGLSGGLLRAADAAGRARAGWLHVARALNQVDTDTMRHLAPTAGEAGDLALCAWSEFLALHGVSLFGSRERLKAALVGQVLETAQLAIGAGPLAE